jgi:hypothetical protein
MQVNAATIVALVVALGGWVLAGATTWLNYKTKTEENFYRALDWLSGGTQKRNLGIAAVEGSWHLRRVRRLSTPLLCSSAVYLLLRSSESGSPNELNNLYRIMAMITGITKIRHEHEFHYRMLLDALAEKLSPGFSSGLDVPNEKVAEWRSGVIAATGKSAGSAGAAPHS